MVLEKVVPDIDPERDEKVISKYGKREDAKKVISKFGKKEGAEKVIKNILG